ncbi:hypothetical protein ASD50_04015 [Mesorhizobium sp. Root552]|jgi:hypothetical protein|uniref:hypothetical protein n=1 Tax=Mesorhizobium sp. Root552 TaxID=1736555 RepID=UPI0006F4BAA4|nr:hypothetical protein [Mesorhizobium sp. Root552]KQZ26577.1 hypothetical protein ASD50_04015 [Mesorhizobium sp. Root552]
MNATEVVRHSSAEAEIDRKAEQLLARILSGSATDHEQAQYRELSAERSRRMMRIGPTKEFKVRMRK